MLRSTTIAVAFGLSLWAFAALHVLDQPLARAAAAVAIGALVTALAYGHATFLSVGVGALSPLAFALLERFSLGWAAATLCCLWLSPRLVLADSKGRLLVLAACSSIAAAIAGFVFAAYVDASWTAQAASCLFAGSCLSLIGLVPVDTGVSVALRAAAAAIEGPSRETLERAARVHGQSKGRGTSSKLWRALVRLADRRAAMQPAKDAPSEKTREELDERIAALAEEVAPSESTPTPITTPTILNDTPEPEVSFEPDARDPADMAAE